VNTCPGDLRGRAPSRTGTTLMSRNNKAKKGGYRAPGDLDATIAYRIENYTPADVPHELWGSTLRPFVIPALIAARPRGIATMEQFARVLTLISVWCLEQGIDLNVEKVLDPDTVERFFALGLRDLPSRGTYRTVLRRLGRELTKAAPWEPRPEPAPRRKIRPPYTPQELALLEMDARAQPTHDKRRTAMGFIALGAGAGLDGRWVTRVRGSDVTRTGDAVLVHVGEPRARAVPVLARSEDLVLALAEAAGDGFIIHRSTEHRNRTNKLAASLARGPDHPVLSVPRLRSTWIVEHLRRGTRLPELLAAAGPTKIESIDDLLQYVEPLDETLATRLLRGGR